MEAEAPALRVHTAPGKVEALSNCLLHGCLVGVAPPHRFTHLS